MSHEISLGSVEINDASHSQAISDVVKRCSPQIWDFYFSDVRNVYFLHTDDLTPEASQTTRELIEEREVTIESHEQRALNFFLDKAMDHLAEQLLDNEDLTRLIHLEAIYERATVQLAPTERSVRLGSISYGSVQSEAIILVPAAYEGFLNLRAATGRLRKSFGDPLDDDSGRETFKVPGLLAAVEIKDYFEKQPLAPQVVGHYL